MLHAFCLILFFANFNCYLAKQWLSEGDSCVVNKTNENGICKFLSNCPSEQAKLKLNIHPTLCGFKGNNNMPIICCPEARPVIQTRQLGDIADEMCRNYSQYVFTEELSPLSIINAASIKIYQCPFEKLPLILGGNASERYEFPHMVQLGFGDKSRIKWACGGSLISEQHILTAGHCVNPENLGLVQYARMGFINVDDTENKQQFNIIERTVHPQYQAPSPYNDIAVLKLEKKPKLSLFLRPACLYNKREVPGHNAIVTGWGRQSEHGPESKVLLKTVLQYYNQSYCNSIFQRTITLRSEGIKEEQMICAGYESETRDACQGDSGGPLQIYSTREGYYMACMYDIIGVTSFGIGCGRSTKIPGVYARVSNYVKWIEDIVWPQ
ncbi:unnamed protein product [Ceutorhynchus assimilis]|uniref:CLIP domain-containing serine protease n=1 Tax=Ceutorhynchus assimilis TaxID=467358 RepID=A0A9N9MU68_9CUCU|nr:unnamed protein product [Ceutorhynchus assimilis]